jgi:hypothetical protein
VDVVDIKGAPWRPSVESLVRSEADFRFRCAASSGRTLVRSLVRSEADSHFRLLMVVLGTMADPWLGGGLPFNQAQKLRQLQLCLSPPKGS